MTEMGGQLWAESEGQGKGATFVMRFPLEHDRMPELKSVPLANVGV
jgi:signal transduction histidine kinase